MKKLLSILFVITVGFSFGQESFRLDEDLPIDLKFRPENWKTE